MKQADDKFTGDLLGGVKRPQGRPVTGLAKSSADRQKARRARLAALGVGTLTVELSKEVLDALAEFVKFKDLKRDDVVERVLRNQLLRKR